MYSFLQLNFHSKTDLRGQVQMFSCLVGWLQKYDFWLLKKSFSHLINKLGQLWVNHSHTHSLSS